MLKYVIDFEHYDCSGDCSAEWANRIETFENAYTLADFLIDATSYTRDYRNIKVYKVELIAEGSEQIMNTHEILNELMQIKAERLAKIKAYKEKENARIEKVKADREKEEFERYQILKAKYEPKAGDPNVNG